ncbi:MAG: hypothetical protein ACLGIN_08075 [Candidatus Sericytochromatia bacterium]
MARLSPLLLPLALLVAACPLSTPGTPEAGPSAPARRAATPAPTAAPSFAPERDPDVEGVRRIDRLSPWIKREGAGAIFTFIFLEKDETTVFFKLKSGIAVSYALYADGDDTPLTRGAVTLKADHEKFTLPAGVTLPDRLRWTYQAALPDRRTLVGEAVTTLE